jgi:hypothetical protein
MKIRLIILFLPLVLFHCSTSKDLTPLELTQRLLINKNWDVTIVTVDGIARNIYPGLSINFQKSSFTASNGLDIFPASGTWSFSDSEGKRILRDDGLEISVESISEGQLILSFYWSNSTFIGGRVSELTGFHNLTFRKRP